MPKKASNIDDSCVFCGEPALKAAFKVVDTRGKDWQWGACSHCGTFSLLPKPSDADLKLAYDTTYYGENEAKFVGPSEQFLSKCRQYRAHRIASLLNDREKPCVLDVGCGNGEFLSALSKHGHYQLWGTELPGPAANRAMRQAEVRLKTGKLDKGSFEAGCFDLITLFHVFEHLPNPADTLMWLHAFLKPGGFLVMSFPNIASCQAILFKQNWLHLDPPRHLFLMPPNSFEKAAFDAGFEIRHRRFFSIEQNPFGMIQSLLNTMGLPRDFLYERLKGNTDYAPHIGSLNVLAQKLFTACCLPLALALDLFESYLMKRGATVEYTLVKRD